MINVALWDRFQDLYNETLNKEPKALNLLKPSLEKFSRDLKNIYFLLKKYNEDISTDFLFDERLIEKISIESWKIEFSNFFDLKITTNFKNEHNRKYIPYNSYNLFKKDGSIRKIVIPCLDAYIIFICSTIGIFDELFLKLPNLIKQLKNVVLLNPLTNDKEFVEANYKSEKDTFIDEDVSPNALHTQTIIAIEYKYCLTIDIENFYNSIYIHDIERIIKDEFYKEVMENNKVVGYINFLHSYNMIINNGETRGIITGPYSSHISSELILLTIDNKINKYIENEGNKIKYTRYVDDYRFYSDDIRALEICEFELQLIFQEYNWKINKNKRKIITGLESIKQKSNDIINVGEEFFSVDSENNVAIDYKKLNSILYSANQALSEHKIFQFKCDIDFIFKKLRMDSDSGEENLIKIIKKFILSSAIEYPHLTRMIFHHVQKMKHIDIFRNHILDDKYLKDKNNLIEKMFNNSLLQLYYQKYYFCSETPNILNCEINLQYITKNWCKNGKIKNEFFEKNPFCSHLWSIKKDKYLENTSCYKIIKENSKYSDIVDRWWPNNKS